MTAHTPTPRRSGAFGSIQGAKAGLDKPIAFTVRHKQDGIPFRSIEEEQANAALIVRAVNAHDALIAAVQRLLESAANHGHSERGHWAPGVCEWCAAVAQARAALKLAGY